MLYLPVYVGLGPILNKLRSKLLPIDIQKDTYGLYSSSKKALSLFDMPSMQDRINKQGGKNPKESRLTCSSGLEEKVKKE